MFCQYSPYEVLNAKGKTQGNAREEEKKKKITNYAMKETTSECK